MCDKVWHLYDTVRLRPSRPLCHRDVIGSPTELSHPGRKNTPPAEGFGFVALACGADRPFLTSTKGQSAASRHGWDDSGRQTRVRSGAARFVQRPGLPRRAPAPRPSANFSRSLCACISLCSGASQRSILPKGVTAPDANASSGIQRKCPNRWGPFRGAPGA